MNRHPVILALIEKALQGETAAAENARLRAHLARCPACREESENAAFVAGLFRRLPRRKVSAGYRRRFLLKQKRSMGKG